MSSDRPSEGPANGAESDDVASDRAPGSDGQTTRRGPAQRPNRREREPADRSIDAAGEQDGPRDDSGEEDPTGSGDQAAGKGGGRGRGGQRRAAKGGAGKGRGQGKGKRLKVLQGIGQVERPDIPDQSHLPAPQRTDLAVRVQDLHITYRTSFERKPTLKQAVRRFGRGYKSVHVVEALKGISFEVKTGTAMGIVGANGAGKSTLMRAMSGTLPPTRGAVEVWGRTSTLLALGVGFNNKLSGRENIVLGGLAAGLSKQQVTERADEIAEWTELGDFIDMPMRTYSSGMFSRVAFSVAVHMEPDILMIDEALSTGDAHFREKASEKMAELRSKARAMFLVSHGLGTIRQLCNEAIWIDKGKFMRRGDPDEVLDAYVEFMKVSRHSGTYDEV